MRNDKRWGDKEEQAAGERRYRRKEGNKRGKGTSKTLGRIGTKQINSGGERTHKSIRPVKGGLIKQKRSSLRYRESQEGRTNS